MLKKFVLRALSLILALVTVLSLMIFLPSCTDTSDIGNSPQGIPQENEPSEDSR